MLEKLLIALACVVAYVIARTYRQATSLQAFGGPWSTQYSRLWLLWANNGGAMHKVFTGVNDKYGPTARVAPHMLLTRDPELIKQMSAVRSSFTRSEWYTALRLHPTRDHIVSITDEELHTSLRNRMSPGYSGKDNHWMEGDIDLVIQQLFSLIEAKYVSSSGDKQAYRPVDLSRIMTFFTLDVISTIAFGQAFGFLVKDDDPFGYIANLQEFLPAIILFSAFTELQKIMRLPILKPLLPKSTDKRGLGKVMSFAQERVQERFKAEDRVVRKDMLQSFIAHGLDKEQLESETLVQITAGSDSTATALRMTLHYISTTPRVLQKLLNEVEVAIAAENITRPIIKESEAKALPYLQACVKEGLRMYPPVTGLLAKEVPAGGVTIDGKLAPGGTWIGWNSFGLMRDKDVFGSDVDLFRPERWLYGEDDRDAHDILQRMNETVGLVFGYGRYGCLGKGVAWMELNKTIIETLLRFELQPINIAKPFDEQCFGFYLHTNMEFRITKRAHELK